MSIKQAVQGIARVAGLDVFRARDDDPTRWSHTVYDYYPVVPRPRWRSGAQPHRKLTAVLDAMRQSYEQFLVNLEKNGDFLHKISKYDNTFDNSLSPVWDNHWFSALDAAALVTILLWKRPKTYIEVGSGNSTLFARYTIEKADLRCKMISIDPKPRRAINGICDRVIRAPLEETPLAIFDDLDAGDILFFDGSHRVFTNSDVTVFFFEVMPRLRPGVVTHIHDIYLPEDYPAEWNARFYSEQYLLAAMLMCDQPPFEVIAPNWFMCRDHDIGTRIRQIFRSPTGEADIPFSYPGKSTQFGTSFWLVTK
jgi:Methyltransferase domain